MGARRSRSINLSGPLAALATVLLLLLIGRIVAAALGSPLLGVMAVGMLFLVGVATRSAIGSRRR